MANPKRLAILLRATTGAGALTIREVARRVGRDLEAVHGDVDTLLQARLVNRTDDGCTRYVSSIKPALRPFATK